MLRFRLLLRLGFLLWRRSYSRLINFLLGKLELLLLLGRHDALIDTHIGIVVRDNPLGRLDLNFLLRNFCVFNLLLHLCHVPFGRLLLLIKLNPYFLQFISQVMVHVLEFLVIFVELIVVGQERLDLPLVLKIVLEEDFKLLKDCLELKIILLHQLLNTIDARVLKALQDLLQRCFPLSSQIRKSRSIEIKLLFELRQVLGIERQVLACFKVFDQGQLLFVKAIDLILKLGVFGLSLRKIFLELLHKVFFLLELLFELVCQLFGRPLELALSVVFDLNLLFSLFQLLFKAFQIFRSAHLFSLNLTFLVL